MEIYLDYAASTPVYPEVLEVLNKSLIEDYANPSSAHKKGRECYQKIKQVKEYCLKVLGENSTNKNKNNDYFIFPSSATEANNTVLKSISYENGDEVFVNYSDHASIVNSAKSWCDCRELKIREIPLEDGFVQISNFINLITAKTKLVMLALVNNHSGHIQQINKIASLIKEKNGNVHIHVDAVQGLFKVPWIKNDCIDSVTISGHKLGAPKGIAGLYLKNNKNYSPLLNGGGQDDGLRSSTLATPLILALKKAMELSQMIYVENFDNAIKLQRYLRDSLGALSEKFVFPFEYSKETMSPYILTCYYRGISGDIFLRHLEEKGIYISTSSACSSKIKGEKAIYNYLEIPAEDHKFVLRISFGPDMNTEKIDHFIKVCKEIIDDWAGLF